MKTENKKAREVSSLAEISLENLIRLAVNGLKGFSPTPENTNINIIVGLSDLKEELNNVMQKLTL